MTSHSDLITTKRWLVTSFYDETDIAYVKGLDCHYELVNSFKAVELPGPDGSKYRVNDITPPGLYVTTINEQQEAMILLKYQSTLTLMQVFRHTTLEF